MQELDKKIKEIVNKAIEENNWNKLSSTEYEEFFKVTELAEQINFEGKKLRREEVTDILEELKICKRQDKKIILTDKGKKYGRYVISICLSDNTPIITDKGYIKYKIEVKEMIDEFISKNPKFLLEKREERKRKRNETRKRNKELKEEK